MNLSLNRSWFSHPLAAAIIVPLFSLTNAARAQAPVYSTGKPWGTVAITALKEASGLAASWKNSGVLWTHNDGSKRKVYGITPAGLHMVTYDVAESAGDIEEIAVGPGPEEGVSYLYLGDIGGNSSPGDIRNSVRILRVPEPPADPSSISNPPSSSLGAADVITLLYPDGSFDAEAMFVDPISAEFFLFTKTPAQSRVYHASLNSIAGGSAATLTFLMTVPVPEPSAADISRDGSRIILRHENAAFVWTRTAGSTVATALSQTPGAAPVIGTPLEPNGEAVAFLTDGSGYMTLSEEASPVLYHFQAQTPMAPAVQSQMLPRTVFTGESVQFRAPVSGYPQPVFTWRLNGTVLPGLTTNTLNLANVSVAQGGIYEVTATNSLGTASAQVTLTVRPRPVLRVTEVQSLPAAGGGADWWELTNFEASAVDLSGWRFNDDSGDLDNAFTFPQGLTIAPGESIIFVDEITPAQFRAWWGAAVPADTQIVTYTGGGLALGTGGDTIRLWDASAASVNETVISQIFGEATPGVSFNFNPANNAFGGLSQFGVNGVSRSAASTDTGSPGAWLSPAAPPALTATNVTGGLRLEFQVTRHHWYTLETADAVNAETWTSQTPVQAAADGPRFLDQPVNGHAKFYRLRIR